MHAHSLYNAQTMLLFPGSEACLPISGNHTCLSYIGWIIINSLTYLERRNIPNRRLNTQKLKVFYILMIIAITSAGTRLTSVPDRSNGSSIFQNQKTEVLPSQKGQPKLTHRYSGSHSSIRSHHNPPYIQF